MGPFARQLTLLACLACAAPAAAEKLNLTWLWHMEQPIYWPDANGTRYERMTLLMNDQPNSALIAPEPNSDLASRVGLDVSNRIKGGDGDDLGNDKLAETQRFLTSFAQELVSQRIAKA